MFDSFQQRNDCWAFSLLDRFIFEYSVYPGFFFLFYQLYWELILQCVRITNSYPERKVTNGTRDPCEVTTL